jgi:hypothetical protein
MMAEFPRGRLLSNVLQELRRNSTVKNWLRRFNEPLGKLRHTSQQLRVSIIDRATVRTCDYCSRTIRPWNRRLLVTEYASAHRSCRESRQFFSELLHQQSQGSAQPPEFLRAADLVELIVASFYDEVQRTGKGSPQSEYIRGMLNGAKSTLAELLGHAIKDQILNEARKRVGKPFPSALALAEDGNRYGWDIEAEAGSP